MKNKIEEYNSTIIDELFESISPIEEKKIRDKMLLAARIEDAMKAKGWNKTDLLRETQQKSPSVITKWLSGTHNFTVDTLSSIEEALGIKLLNIRKKNEEVVVKFKVTIESSPTITTPSSLKSNPIKIINLPQVNSFVARTTNA